MKEYTTPQLAEELGIKPRKVISFVERGYIKASVQAANGHPSSRIFNENDLKIAKIALLLQKRGFTPKRIFLWLFQENYAPQKTEYSVIKGTSYIERLAHDIECLSIEINSIYRGEEIPEDEAVIYPVPEDRASIYPIVEIGNRE